MRGVRCQRSHMASPHSPLQRRLVHRKAAATRPSSLGRSPMDGRADAVGNVSPLTDPKVSALRSPLKTHSSPQMVGSAGSQTLRSTGSATSLTASRRTCVRVIWRESLWVEYSLAHQPACC